MLRQILAMLATGGTRSLAALAFELGLDVGTTSDILARLTALGYVEELFASLDSSCSDGGKIACTGCPAAMSCGKEPKSRVWSLSAKGRKSLDRPVA